MENCIKTEKECSRCNSIKPLEDFSKREDSKDGRKGICNLCYKKKACERDGRFFIDKTTIKNGYNVCTKCHEEKEISEFKSDIKNTCKECLKSVTKICITEKFCTKCSTLKNKDDFAINNYSKDGLSTDCKKCKQSYEKREYEPITEGNKICKSCQVNLHVSEFHKDKKLKDGLNSYCKECNKNKVNSWKKANKDKVRDYNKQLKNSSELHKLANRVRGVVFCSFKRACEGRYKKSKRTEEILGCTVKEFL